MSFYTAAREGDTLQLKRFLEAGANVNQKFNGDRTALHFACDSGNIEVVKLLMEFKADPDIPDNFNKGTPLHIASESGNLEIARLLLSNNADVNVQDGMNRETPLHLASEGNLPQMVSLLLDHKADPGILNLYQKEAMSYAKRQHMREEFQRRGIKDSLPAEASGVHSQGKPNSSQANRPWYGGSTIVGKSFGGAEKENQDAFFLIPRVGGDPGIFLFGVTDGHGRFGRHVSQLVKQNIYRFIDTSIIRSNKDGAVHILTEACTSLQQMLQTQGDFDSGNSGCTLVMALLIDDVLFVSNTGDSRCVLASAGQDGRLAAIPLSEDHIPSDEPERERIEAAGGVVKRSENPIEGGEYGRHRVWRGDMTGPGLAMSRSLGDLQAHQVGVSHIPDVLRHDLRPEDKLLLIASDGVWDMFSNEEAVDIVARTGGADGNADANLASSALCDAALRAWELRENRVDDITVVTVVLPQRRRAASLNPITAQPLSPPSPALPGRNEERLIGIQDRFLNSSSPLDGGVNGRTLSTSATQMSTQIPLRTASNPVGRTPSHIIYSVEAERPPTHSVADTSKNYIPEYSPNQKLSPEDPWSQALRTIGLVQDREPDNQRRGDQQEEECVIQ